ncbi:MAG TPA: tetratricopeptide repeat protein [Candidatus Wujingus californicus]|uniref:tetratricopeptide repeat protein n=1 Tax=Candidatus Wujingus californicus TaxID=3367618 RepID=UPI001D4D3B7B|nr:hypothetical protein [Planctomycetota bacterium]MDO8094667.1 tetratricopeptide repeat protein [Candidatus Brocadiales bacterium]MDO8130673.1 tetratricopeptide repeat protein [Candidatus Brocadiales bacterium]
MPLSSKEIKYLMDKAESYIEIAFKEDFSYFEKAVKCYDEIIENAPPHPHYFAERASIKHLVNSVTHKYSLDDVIKDMDRAIESSPDEGKYYAERGVYLLDKWGIEGDISKRELLEKSIEDFDACTHKDPTQSDAWLHLMEANVLLERWDYVIGRYGECKPYMENEHKRLLRSWLGCLAMTFAGYPIDEADKQPLYDHTHDHTIKLGLEKPILHIFYFFLNESTTKERYKAQWEEINKINQLLFDHVQDLISKGFILHGLGRDQEALQAFEKATKENPHNVIAWRQKGLLLVGLNRYEEALKAFEEHNKLNPGDVMPWYFRACMYSLRNDKKNALANLSKAIELDTKYKEPAKKEDDFKTLWDDEDFKRIVG